MSKKDKKNNKAEGVGIKELSPWPEYIDKRITLWNKLKSKYEKELASKPDIAIVVSLPDGKKIEGKAWRTSPYEIAQGIR